MKYKRLILIILIILVVTKSVYMLYPMPYKEYIFELADEYDLEPTLIYAIIQTETHFDYMAVSRSNAKGLMQIMDMTGEWGADELDIDDFTPEMLFNPYVNIRIGTWYIDKLISQYDANVDMALMAYNAGSGNVAKWLADTKYSSDGKTVHTIPFNETKNYIKKVNFHKRIYDLLY
ncbi:MAG: lytic transglycosylase [Epulopiscium sp. Nele67-Bin001]|nr:MAG: lytic transglycosylase [Epulopiscium sp. Nuni2H_MBin001]OON92227.1 MAG: lytic transglycosylase [Epulopiscium sp. Nele67-Bin001]